MENPKATQLKYGEDIVLTKRKQYVSTNGIWNGFSVAYKGKEMSDSQLANILGMIAAVKYRGEKEDGINN